MGELARLLVSDPEAGIAEALDLLAGEPRVKPSGGLLIDPHERVVLRWRARVAAAVALLESPVAERVIDAVYDELSDDAELAEDVLSAAAVTAALSQHHRRRLDRLRSRRGPRTGGSPGA